MHGEKPGWMSIQWYGFFLFLFVCPLRLQLVIGKVWRWGTKNSRRNPGAQVHVPSQRKRELKLQPAEKFRCTKLKLIVNYPHTIFFWQSQDPLHLSRVAECVNGFAREMILNFANSFYYSSSVTLLENRLDHSSFLFYYSDSDFICSGLPFCL